MNVEVYISPSAPGAITDCTVTDAPDAVAWARLNAPAMLPAKRLRPNGLLIAEAEAHLEDRERTITALLARCARYRLWQPAIFAAGALAGALIHAAVAAL